MTTVSETVVWTGPHLFAWVSQHLAESHRMTVQPLDGAPDCGTFVCSCGQAIDVQPMNPSDVTVGLYLVTGETPLETPTAPPADRQALAAKLLLCADALLKPTA